MQGSGGVMREDAGTQAQTGTAGKARIGMKAMAQVIRKGAKTAAAMFAVWVVILGVLAAMPGESMGSARGIEKAQHSRTVYYVHSQTNTTVQDVDGTVSVQIRALRPVTACTPL